MFLRVAGLETVSVCAVSHSYFLLQQLVHLLFFELEVCTHVFLFSFFFHFWLLLSSAPLAPVLYYEKIDDPTGVTMKDPFLRCVYVGCMLRDICPAAAFPSLPAAGQLIYLSTALRPLLLLYLVYLTAEQRPRCP